MSEYAINQYLGVAEKIVQYGGTKKETAIRTAFFSLLNEYAKGKGLLVVAEVTIKGTKGKNVTPDGTLKDSLRQDWGYWESKDESDKIEDEIKKKFDRGYPKENILFEDSQTAILYQNGYEVKRVKMSDPAALDSLLKLFVSFERPEVIHFRKAIELFKQDIPKVTETLRGIIGAQEKTNIKFVKASEAFLKLCHESINPDITSEDVREMIIQHILTEDIFNTIFDETQFHRENNIARELEKVISTFFTGNTKRIALSTVQHYYQTINAAAAGIADHHEKQKFLKVVYETFYKSYNPKAADRLGVVYTPNEIVRFMVESTDYLLNKHFGKSLEDKGVDILDPATGTGTFICDIIDFIRKDKLDYKYAEELHANEVAILPYYISNLNIEYTYKQKTGSYKEFQSLCFVDTLDNLNFKSSGKQIYLFESLTVENSKRIKKQNEKKISVIIGNPPYNSNQMNENDNNKNKAYIAIDKRIKDTFIENGTAQKSKMYDMYARFYRWSMDRIDENGLIAFITNNSFVNTRTFDGFRKSIQDEFDFAYIVDFGGNIRELSGKDGIFLNEKHTIFGQAAAVGIAIMFLIKSQKDKNKICNIQYIHPTDIRATRDEKLQFINETSIKEIKFEHISPDKKNNWINLSINNWDNLVAIQDKNVKLNKSEKAIFKVYTNGIATGRDEWVYDYNKTQLSEKNTYFISEYNSEVERWVEFKTKNKYIDTKDESNPIVDNFLHTPNNIIKWSKMIKRDKFRKGKLGEVKSDNIIFSHYRPFFKTYYNSGYILNDVRGQFDLIFPNKDAINTIITFNNFNNKSWDALAVNTIVDYNFLYGGANILSLYIYYNEGNKIDNITTWGLIRFTKFYKLNQITKLEIFNYLYGVLSSPNYKNNYEQNLRREFPRIPFYKNFYKWSNWGKRLMDLHINYETIEPFKLKQITNDNKEQPKAKLKANRETGIIVLDENTTLTGVPPEAWNYKLGNRSTPKTIYTSPILKIF